MGKQRKGPPKKPADAAEPAEEDVGAGENELGEVDDFDHFLETMDESSESENEDDEGDPSEDEAAVEDTSDDDEGDEDGQEMEPEEDEDLNEDESEEEGDSDEQENSDDQLVEEEGEEGVPIENGIGGDASSDDGESESGQLADTKKLSAKSHKMDLQKLQETDPEFFTFLKENDAELLDFDDSDDGSESDSEEALHQPPETLEEASDSEAEEERMDDTSKEHKLKVQKLLKKGEVNILVISYWETQLSETREISILSDVIEALQCAVGALSQGDTGTAVKWRVEGSANFNALIRLCIREIKGFCIRFLCGNNNVEQSENKFDQRPFDVIKDKAKQKWIRLRPKIKSYMEIMVQLFQCMGNPEAISSLLKHCHRMSGFWALWTTKSLKLLRSLVDIWAQGEDSCRVIAFLTIIRTTNYNKDVFLLHMFKQMYIAYVDNCKFTSVNTWPAINFMRSSLVELYLLDTNLAYTVAFPFIRQLAIHLRNALSPGSAPNEGKHRKSEASRVVYSWQFVHSLHLWVDVLAQSGNKDDTNLKLLIYPLVQICMGTLKLIPTKKFIPIRFHIIRMLIKLQEKAGVFIPVLPLITEVLRMADFTNKNSASKFSVRPLDLSCCLKADSSESGYLKAIAENVFETILLYCKGIATDLGFPEIVTPTVMHLKSFIKRECKNIEVIKNFKLLLEKIESNSKYISERRNKAMEAGTVTLADKKSHRILQVQMQTTKPHPPLLVYAADYFKLNQKTQIKSQKSKVETKEEKLIPKPSAKKHSKANAQNKSDDFEKPLFNSDSEESDTEFTTKLDESLEAKATKRPNKRKIQAEDDTETEQKSVQKKKKKKDRGKKKKALAKVEDQQDKLLDYELSDSD